MLVLVEGRLTFTFPAHWEGAKYDDWSHYRKHFIGTLPGIKAVDFLVVEPKVCCWLIEAKDYRTNRRTKSIDLADEVAAKVVNALAGLVAAQFRASDQNERTLAHQALRAADLRVVLHLEQPLKPSRLFPTVANPLILSRRLKARIKSIDPHPLVVDKANMNRLPWTVH